MKFVRIALGLLFMAFLAACGGGGGSSGANPNAGPLRTTAGDSVVIAPGETRAYTITGGVAPYSVRNGDPAIALGSVSGTQLTIAAKGIGSTTVEVVDNGGTATSVAVRVGSSTPLSVTAPANLSMALGPAAAQTFDVRGGVAPYVAVSSDARIVGVSLNPTTLKLTVTGISVGQTSVSVRDGAGEAVSFAVSTTAAQSLVVQVPTPLFVGVGTTQTYKILGGVKPYQVSSGNPAVLNAIKQFEDDLVIRGVAGGEAVVVVSDIAGSVVTFNATVGSSSGLFTTAPTQLTLSGSEVSPTFAIGGGAAPYTVVSSNSSIAAVTFSGTAFSVTAGTVGGSAPVVITDSRGVRIQVTVTVTAPVGGEVVTPAASVEVLTSSNTLLSGGTSVDITAFVKSALNVAIPDAAISFSADSGLLQNASVKTDVDGKGTAKLLVGNDKSNRVIRVTVRSGSASGFVNVTVSGSRVILTGAGAVQLGETSDYTVRVEDSSRVGVAGATVTFVSALGNTVNPAVVTTNELGIGTVPVRYTAVNPSAPNGPDLLTADWAGTKAIREITVSDSTFEFISPDSEESLSLGVNVPVTVRYTKLVGGVVQPQVGVVVRFTTTRGNINATAVTNANGDATATLTSTADSGSGPFTVQAEVDDVAQASLPLIFTSLVPSSISLQANPSAIPPNEGTGAPSSKSTLLAVVRDASGNPVVNRQVNFRILSDVSGGSLSSPSARTDANGRAQVDYVAGTSASATDGVEVSATDALNSSVTATARLTVSRQALFITIAVGNTITNLDPSTYSKPFSVYVTDATGNPVGNQQITLTVEPLAYITGALSLNISDDNWFYTGGVPAAFCKNTDLNKNGFLDAGEDGPLRPGNVALATPSSVTTNAQGIAEFSLVYGEQFAPWVIVDVIARAFVGGTASSNRLTYLTTGSAADFTGLPGPTGVVSPYGSARPADCVDYP